MTDNLYWLRQRVAELEAQNAVQANEIRHLQNTLYALPVFVCLVDREGKLRYCNHWQPDSESDAALIALIVPEQREAMIKAFKGVLKTGKATSIDVKHAILLEWFRVRISPPDSDGTIMVVGRNINEQLAYEHALAQSEQRHRMITALTSDFAFSVIRQPDGTDEVTWITNTVNEQLDYPSQAIRASHYDISELIIHDDDQTRVFADAERTLEGENTVTEYRAITKRGDIRVLRVARMPMWNEGEDTIIGYYAAATDITEEKRAAEMLIEKEKLETALTKERELADLKSRYMSMLVHEFRTPLTIVMSNTSLIYTYWDKLSAEKRAKNYHSIVKAINYLSEMLQDLSLFIRSERGYIEYQAETVDLVPLCSTIIADIRQTDGRQHVINFKFDTNIGHQVVDPALLKHILVNLLSNAIKYSPVGSAIDFELKLGNDLLVFKICDKGIGIPEVDMPRIFEPFHRGNNVDEVPGTGIGLAIVKEAVDAHQGTINVDSQPGEGTKVIFTIPISE